MSCFSVDLDVSGILLCLWDPIGRRIGYIVKLKENLESLENSLEKLKCLKNDKLTMVARAEGMLREPTDSTKLWLKGVEDVDREVAEMKEAFQQMMIIRCFGRNFRPNFYSGYKLVKRVMKKQRYVADLINEGKAISFDDVAVQPPPAAVEVMRGAPALGMDESSREILRWLRKDDNVQVIGIYGIGGVGKTTLLKKINNEFLAGLGEFHVVIWVVVSKEASVGKIQNEIGKKLGLSFVETASDEDRARDIFRALKKKRFILLLDDIWERVDLEEKVGIPLTDSQNKSKVVFTTRSEGVCGLMEANRVLEVKCLGSQDAWDLFEKNVGEEAMSSRPEIPDLAKSVVEQCRGLPLALITVGRAMARKKKLEEWKHAIAALEMNKARPNIKGTEDKVFVCLKFSYDVLDQTLQKCFLYCSLFPEDYNIVKEELIDYWIGEEIINGGYDVEKARNEGHYLIGELKRACMLESGYNEEKEVKMHDVVRDLALWIASKEHLVQAGVRLRKEPELDKWTEEVKRVSLMENYVQEITVTPSCPNLLTLILRNNPLNNISNSFFQHMPCLRVLDLSNTGDFEFPLGIWGLAELRYLNLSGKELLRFPEEMGNLENLTHLDLTRYDHNDEDVVLHIPRGVISRLSKLKVLKMYMYTIANGGFEEIKELEELQHLTHLEICVYGDFNFRIFLQSPKLPKVTFLLTIEELTDKTISAPLEVMQSLRELMISKCKDLEELMIGADRRTNNNCSILIMDTLILYGLPKLSIIRFGWSSLQNLLTLEINRCHKLKNLTSILQLHNIQEITLFSCNSLEEVIGSNDVEVGAEGLKCLTSLSLQCLPALTSISNQARSFSSLKKLIVRNCNELKKLNIHCNTDTPLNISCGKKWWDGLEWEEKSMRSHILSFFKFDRE